MPLPPTLPHASTFSSAESTTTLSSSTTQASVSHRLLESVPEHAVHLLEKLFAPNTISYTHAKNDSHASAPTSPTLAQQGGIMKSYEWRTEISSSGEGKKKEASGRRSDGFEDQALYARATGSSEEIGVPLCREAEIEKWNEQGYKERRKITRRYTFH